MPAITRSMSLKTRISLVLLATIVPYVAISYSVQRLVVQPRFDHVESDKADDDLARAIAAIQQELAHLSNLVHDWSAWDDTYKYVVDRNQAFAESNLQDTLFAITKINLLMFATVDGEIIYHHAHGDDLKTDINVPELPTDRFPRGHVLTTHADTQSAVRSILLTRHGPMLICSRPILNSEDQGPVRGTVVMGRLLSQEACERLSSQTRVPLHIWPVDSPEITAVDRDGLAACISSERPHRLEQDDLLLSYQTLPGLDGRPALLVRSDTPRDISAEGRTALYLSLALLLGAGAAVFLLLAVLLKRIVVGPVARLTAHATQIGASGDLSQRLDLNRHDEIGALASEFNAMVAALAESRAMLADASRQAGMADVARSVLHNVGNVLNSANVSASVLTERLRQSKISGLSRAAELMRSHETDMEQFLTQSPQGKQLPNYLIQLADVVAAEQKGLLTELDTLTHSIDHLKEIVLSQQAYARPGTALPEPGSLSDVATTAIAMMQAALDRHGVRLERRDDSLPQAALERSKLLQVLVNLLTNAKEALGARLPGERRLRVHVRAGRSGFAAIEITDNGCGVRPEDLARIFRQGFTTKSDGHGFGLHYCATAVREMGGHLTARSDGPDCGATFVIELPLAATRRQVKP